MSTPSTCTRTRHRGRDRGRAAVEVAVLCSVSVALRTHAGTLKRVRVCACVQSEANIRLNSDLFLLLCAVHFCVGPANMHRGKRRGLHAGCVRVFTDQQLYYQPANAAHWQRVSVRVRTDCAVRPRPMMREDRTVCVCVCACVSVPVWRKISEISDH